MSHSIRWLSIANQISGGKDVLWYPCRSHHVSAPRVMDPVGATTRKFLPLLTWAALIQSIKMDSWEKIKKRRIPPAPLVPHSLCTRFISAFKTRKTEKTRRRINTGRPKCRGKPTLMITWCATSTATTLHPRPSSVTMAASGLRAKLSLRFDLILIRSDFIVMRFVAACEIDLISWIFNDKEKENLTTYKIGLRAGWCSIHCIGIFWIRIWTVLNFIFSCFDWIDMFCLVAREILCKCGKCGGNVS